MNSLGGIYSRLSTSIFKDWNCCGKVMGLAPYGCETLTGGREERGKIFPFIEGDLFEGNLEVNNEKLEGVPFCERLKVGDLDFCNSDDIDIGSSGLTYEGGNDVIEEIVDTCYNMQKDLEDSVILSLKKIANQVFEDGENMNLLLAGGVTLNSVLNGAIIRSNIFDNVYIPPFVGDEGIAFGCAAYGMISNTPNFGPNFGGIDFTPYTGPEYSGEEVEDAFSEFKSFYDIIHDDVNDLPLKIAKFISEGNVLALYKGRSEIGPRALGNRSILADPRRGGIVNLINSKIKVRESYRPFAPSVLAEDVKEWFEDGDGDVSPFMSLTLFLRKEKRGLVNAVMHVDGSSRLQTVTESRNTFYYNLILEFKKLTGVPMVLNTSFNTLKGEPIVESPREAFVSWLARAPDLRYLVINDKILERRKVEVGEGDRFKAFGRFVTITNENYEGDITDVRVKMEGREEVSVLRNTR
ncbi:hypothetical protein TrLO_g4289 [Triparma laevis f. longispina]|uniref:Carbamoyltransferase n=1 Tax=Triparma laevis f. longispina TaxID=1714387 RepID=A0A9W7DVR3_9STRA|nr:hypothetical protein TrLO_g4289 [Triparma laevis f. longispina]